MYSSVYVVQRGAILRRKGEVFLVFVDGKLVAEIPARELRQMVLMGNVMVTPACFDLLIDRGIDTVFLSHYGKFRARLEGEVSSNAALRLAQMRFLMEPDRALGTAKLIVEAKIKNQRELLMHWMRRNGHKDTVKRAIVGMKASTIRLADCGTLDEVRGCEGAAAAAYFAVFGSLILNPDFRFDGRNRRPPMDPVNAMLSFQYTLLQNAVEASVRVVGLDPYIGALHSVESGRASLACDLVEEFRAIVVDSVVLASINRGAIKADDFEDAGPGEPVLIKREGIQALVRLFEKRLERRIKYREAGTMTMRAVIEQQSRRFARHMWGKEEYAGFVTSE